MDTWLDTAVFSLLHPFLPPKSKDGKGGELDVDASAVIFALRIGYFPLYIGRHVLSFPAVSDSSRLRLGASTLTTSSGVGAQKLGWGNSTGRRNLYTPAVCGEPSLRPGAARELRLRVGPVGVGHFPDAQM